MGLTKKGGTSPRSICDSVMIGLRIEILQIRSNYSHMVYLVTNTATFKNYVGQTGKTLEERRRQHEKNARGGRLSRFYSALRKYGAASFQWRVLIAGTHTKKETDAYEKFFISLFSANDVHCGYNLTAGGEGLINPSKETREKMSLSHKGKTHNKGRKFTGEIREQMIRRLRGHTGNLGHHHSQNAKDKMRAAHLGKNTGKRSFETREKMRIAACARELNLFLATVAWG
jgi:group I intron endonuclease